MAIPARMSLDDAGRRLLGEVEETSLEEVLCRIRAEAGKPRAQYEESATVDVCQHVRQAAGGNTAQSPVKPHRAATAGLRLPTFPVPELQQVVASHFHATRSPELVVGGSRPLSLVYFLVATLIASHRYAVVVVDVEARFDVQRLLGMQPAVLGGVSMSTVREADLAHVHVFRADPRWSASVRELVIAAEQRALYGMQRRRDRPLWGTVAVGGTAAGASAPTTANHDPGSVPTAGAGGAGAALATGYYGWLRVEASNQESMREGGAQPMREQRLVALFKSMGIGPDDGHRPDKSVRESGLNPERPHSECGNDMSGARRVLLASPRQVDGAEHVIWVASCAWGSFAFSLSGRPETNNETPSQSH